MKRSLLAATHHPFRGRVLLLLVPLLPWLAGCPARAAYAVSVTPAARTHWQAHTRALGEVRSLSRAILRAPVSGRLGRFPVRDGSYVAAGGFLGRVAPPGLTARIAAARSRLQLAHQLLGHDRALYRQRLVTRSAVQRAVGRVAVDEDALRALELKRRQTRLIAPAAGTVHYLVPPGTEIAAGTPVMRLGGAGLVWIRTFLPPSATRLLHAGQTAVLQGAGGSRGRARVTAIGDSARDDGLVEVFLHPAGKGLLPGEWLWISLPAASGYAWRVPRPALVMQGSRARIYILRHHHAHAVPVTVVHVASRYVWLRGPLHPDESIIVRGAAAVTDGTPVTVGATPPPLSGA